MIIKINKRVYFLVFAAFSIILLIIYLFGFRELNKYNTNNIAGGNIREIALNEDTKAVFSEMSDTKIEYRFRRPSSQVGINDKFQFQEVQKDPSIIQNIKSLDDVIYAYYGVLKEASNMVGYSRTDVEV